MLFYKTNLFTYSSSLDLNNTFNLVISTQLSREAIDATVGERNRFDVTDTVYRDLVSPNFVSPDVGMTKKKVFIKQIC